MQNYNTKPSELVSLTDWGYTAINSVFKNLIRELKVNSKSGDVAVNSFIRTLQARLKAGDKVNREVLMAMIGEMSSGKSSQVNTLLGYPLLPVARLATSACPVEIRYGEKFRLDVFTYEKTDNGFDESVRYTFDSPKELGKTNFDKLMGYARQCVSARVIRCEHTDYYYDISNPDESADFNDVLQCAQLLIVLLNVHIGQDFEKKSEKREQLIEKRRKLFEEIIKVPFDVPIGVRIWVKSEVLRNGLTLVDLPGLGSTENDDSITTNYVNRAHSCVLLFEPEAKIRDAKSALEMMRDYEIMRAPGQNSRFIVAVNKCDALLDHYGDYYAEQLETAVNSINGTMGSIQYSEVIPISAYYAEYRLVDNGIAPERTITGRKLARMGMDADAIRKQLLKNYELEFQYYDERSESDVAYSTRRYMEETIGQYAAKVRCMNFLKDLMNICSSYREVLSGLNVEAKMIALLEVLGQDLMKELLDKMRVAVMQAQSDFIDNVDKIVKDMNDSRVALGGILTDEVCPAYEKGLRDADGQLKKIMDGYVSQMDSDFAGHYIVDDKDTRSRANKSLFEKMKTELGDYDFNPHLQAGNNILSDYLDKQRASYANGVDSLDNCFLNLISRVDQLLDDVFSEFLKNPKLADAVSEDGRGSAISAEVQQIYKDCFDDAKQSMIDYLNRLHDGIMDDVNNDTGVADAIDETVGVVFSYFSGMISRYRTACARYIVAKSDTTFFRSRPHLRVSDIRKAIDTPFIDSNERKDYVAGLKDKLINQNNDKSHSVRLYAALQKVSSFLLSEVVVKVKRFLPSIRQSVELDFGTGADKIRKRYAHLGETAGSLHDSLARICDQEDVEAFFSAAKDMPWATEDAAACRKVLERVCGEIAKFAEEMIERSIKAADEAEVQTEAAAEDTEPADECAEAGEDDMDFLLDAPHEPDEEAEDE